MSGGLWDYLDSGLKNEIFGWCDEWHDVLEDREISELVWDVLELLHEFDWYRSGDTGKDTYLDAKKAFKNKWFGGNRGLMIRRIVDDALAETKAELYETFGIGEKNEKSDG